MIRYDSLLVRHLAAELDRELRHEPVHAIQFDSSDQRLLLDIGDIRLVWELHPAKGWLSRTAPLYPLPDSAILPRRARVRSVDALEDERVLRISLGGEKRENATFAVVVELLTNQWNAFALDDEDKVLRVLKLRETGRVFRRGQNYLPPERPDEPRPAYRSPLNEHLSESAFAAMLAEAPLPSLINTSTGRQPYPHHLCQADSQTFETLLQAFAALAGSASSEAIVRELERRVRVSEKKITRLRAELAKADADEKVSREHADLLLAYASTFARGTARVTLPGFEGTSVVIELDPRLNAIENAQLLYFEARKHDRAKKRIPALIDETETQRDRAAALLLRAQRGELTEIDLKAIAPQPAAKTQQGYVQRLPYRSYRTTGGLEVRVGRDARSNDQLTLHHSSPRDIWLHARHVGGAHVVLRWQDAQANPPHRDLVEAATLAALHSAARTSNMVPVDYTRRKYVRKPRHSPPGTVMIERAKTVFVEPDAKVEEALRA